MALLVPHLGRAAAPRLFVAAVAGSSSSGRRAFSADQARSPRCAPRSVVFSPLLGHGSSSSLPAIARRAFTSAAARRQQGQTPPPPPGGSKPDGGLEGVLRDIKKEVETKLGGAGGIVEKGKAALRDVQGRGEELRHAAGSAGEQALKKGHDAAASLQQDAKDRAVQYGKEKLSEDIMTLPNVLTMLRLASCPVLGYLIATGQLRAGVALLFVAGASDALDGYIARKRGSFTVFGSIADPAADKALMTTMVIALAYRGLLPMPLAVLIIGRDVLLVISAFFVRFRTLSPPRTLARYFNPRLPSATVVPTAVSKANTALQLVLVGTATLMPLLPPVWQSNLELPWTALTWIVAATTVWSGLGYLGGGGSQKVLAKAAEVASVAAKRK